MNLFPIALASAAALLLSSSATAHGGIYRGPGDTVPPGARPRTAPKTPTPKTPNAPNPHTPNGPPPTTPHPHAPRTPHGVPTPTGRRSGPPRTGPRVYLSEDLTRWQFWWEFNKDRFLRLKNSLYAGGTTTGDAEIFMGPTRQSLRASTMRPSDADIDERVLPALKRALDSTEQRDITSSCVTALGKIGRDHAKFSILDLMRARMNVNDQEVRETCALAMGISGKVEAVDDLMALALDRPGGRKLVGRSFVGDRTRSFAIYGIGLVAHRVRDSRIKDRVLRTMETILNDDSIADRNVRVAAIHAIGLLNAERDRRESDPKSVLNRALDVLDRYYQKKLGSGTALIQSHVPTSVCRLLGRGKHGRRAGYLKLWRDELLRSGNKKAPNDIYRSAALALGQMAPTSEGDALSVESRALFDYFQKGKDQQARYFALMSMAQVGGPANRRELLKVLRKGIKALERPWAAIALGVQCHHAYGDEPSPEIDRVVGDELLNQLQKLRNPEARAAMAIGLGLCRYGPAVRPLRDVLADERKDELAGYLCIGLALMGDKGKSAKDQIHEMIKKSSRRPERLKQAAMALGKFGDRRVNQTMIEMLEQNQSTNLAKLSSIANALTFIGDRRSIPPLIRLLDNRDLNPLSRAFAAVALGGVADKEEFRWNAKIAANINYRAAVETLTGAGAGVLDIL